MKVLLVGNYPYEGSTSMLTWARALERELRQLGIDVRLIAPKPLLGRLKPSGHGVGKWLGYADRFLFFPFVLRAAAARADVVHLCDHGSAVYVPMVNGTPVVVTCHDMHAVLGALGEVPDCPASFFGRQLQRWIADGLRRATRTACVSQATYEDAARILGRSDHLSVILNGLNYPFGLLTPDEADARLEGIFNVEKPFLLHVGSCLRRKNREGVLRVFAEVVVKADLQLVFAGQGMNDELTQLAQELGVHDRVVQVVKPEVKIIEALYNRALALLFPSRYEGFGWPPIEAQACGCPVVASDIAPIAAAVGDSAAVHRLDDEAGMAESILKIANDENYRDRLRQLGFENVRSRFQTSRMMVEYVSLYRQVACQN